MQVDWQTQPKTPLRRDLFLSQQQRDDRDGSKLPRGMKAILNLKFVLKRNFTFHIHAKTVGEAKADSLLGEVENRKADGCLCASAPKEKQPCSPPSARKQRGKKAFLNLRRGTIKIILRRTKRRSIRDNFLLYTNRTLDNKESTK